MIPFVLVRISSPALFKKPVSHGMQWRCWGIQLVSGCSMTSYKNFKMELPDFEATEYQLIQFVPRQIKAFARNIRIQTRGLTAFRMM